MAAYRFSAAERYAVFTAHNERCWLCRAPLGLLETEVDHIIPESLIGQPELEAVLKLLGLPATFDLNDFANWMPAHPRCNREKSNAIFDPTPLIQLQLQAAASKAARARMLRDRYVSDRTIANAINRLLAAKELGELDDAHRARLTPLVAAIEQEHEANRLDDIRGKPLFLAPWLEIIAHDENWVTLRGPGGLIGRRPAMPAPHSSWDCPNCGVTGWNGARCIMCGMLDDGD